MAYREWEAAGKTHNENISANREFAGWKLCEREEKMSEKIYATGKMKI